MFLLFLGLRLTDNIDWAWYWVGAPLWMPAALVLGIAAIVAVVAVPMWLVGRRGERKRRAAMTQAQRDQADRVKAAWRKVGL